MKNIVRYLTSLKYLYLLFLLLIFNAAHAQEITVKNKIDLLLYNGKYAEALPVIDSEIAKDTLDASLYYKSGMARQGLYQHDKAIGTFQKAIKLDNKNPTYYLAIGRSYSALGYSEESISAYQKAFEIDSSNMNTAFTLIGALISDNQFQDAINLTSKMVKQDSTNSLLYSQLAYCFMKIDSLKLAANYYEKAYSLNNTNLNSMQQLIILDIKLGNYEPASKLIYDGLQRFKKMSAFPRLKADLSFKKKEYNGAITNYLKAIEMGDSTLSNLEKLGLSYYFYVTTNDSLSYNRKMQFFEKADSVLGIAWQRDQENPLICYYLGIMKARIGKFDDAIKIFDSALDITIPGFANEIYNYLGDCLRIQKYYEDAVDAYKSALSLKPYNVPVINNIGTVYLENLKDPGALIRFYEEFLSRNRDLDKDLRTEITEKIEQLKVKFAKVNSREK